MYFECFKSVFLETQESAYMEGFQNQVTYMCIETVDMYPFSLLVDKHNQWTIKQYFYLHSIWMIY